MRDQDTFARIADVNVGLDQIAAAAHVGCHLGRQVPHPCMEHVTFARSVEAAGIDDEALAKAVIKRQYMMLPYLLPPKIHQRSELEAPKKGIRNGVPDPRYHQPLNSRPLA
jgi:hypothetical protein